MLSKKCTPLKKLHLILKMNLTVSTMEIGTALLADILDPISHMKQSITSIFISVNTDSCCLKQSKTDARLIQ